MGPFAESAADLARHNLAVIPTGGDSGKEPLIKHANWSHPPGQKFVASLAEKYPDANTGILTGLSNVSVVDIDDPKLIAEMIKRCGKTPLMTSTPSGGAHLWYRSNGEKSANLRNSDGLAVDIKAGSGVVVVPPSISRSGPHEGLPYKLMCGDWEDLQRLPTAKSGSLLPHNSLPTSSRPAVRQGVRNKELFKYLLRQASACDDFDALLDVARTFNEDCMPPLSDAEVIKTAKSAWDMEINDKNWAGKPPHITLKESDVNMLAPHPNALALLCVLINAHGARIEPFAISTKAMARKPVISGWSHKRYANARDKLLELGYIDRLHKGGAGRHDPSQYRLVNV